MVMTILLMLLALFVGFAQQSCDVKTISLDKEFDLKVGQNGLVKSEGLVIGFTSVVEDSRCPEDVDCIWAGNAKINIKAAKGNDAPVSADINTTSQPQKFSYQQYHITLVRLLPRPKADAPVSEKDYIATLLITKQ